MRFDERGLVACICQDAESGDVLMLAWANREALERTLESAHATFYSRSRGELWEKGATSGNVLDVVELALDCDGDAVLVRCHPRGPACHTGAATCFGARRGHSTDRQLPFGRFLAQLAATIGERREADPAESYVARLLGAPREHVARKLGEEAVESILAQPASDALVAEIADLWFHSMLLLARDGLDPLAPLVALERRHRGATGARALTAG